MPTGVRLIENVSTGTIWKVIVAAASVVLAWVWIQSQFLGVTRFEVYASGVQAQVSQTTKALLMQELRWLQAQRRQAKKDGDQDEYQRLSDEISTIQLQIKGLK